MILTKPLLSQLRFYWMNDTKNKEQWFFPAKDENKNCNPDSLNVAFKNILNKTSIIKSKTVTCHTLRHSWATHMLEEGINLRYLQVLLGHSSIVSTSLYTQLVDYKKIDIKSPLDLISNQINFGGHHGKEKPRRGFVRAGSYVVCRSGDGPTVQSGL